MSNLRTEVQAFVKNYPNKIRFISGKWFDENDNEIKNIDRFFFNLANEKEFKPYFLFFKKPDDIHNFEELFIIGYGSDGIWCLPKTAKLVMDDVNNNRPRLVKEENLPFPLTYEQALIIGQMLFKPSWEYFYILTGIAHSGKSTFGNIVKQLFDEDVASVNLDELEGFKLAEAVKHRLIYSEEISNKELNCSNLKMLASKEEITVEPKFVTPYFVKTQSALLFNCNKAPKIDVEDSGILRRLIFYRRDKRIDNPDLSLEKKIYTEEELVQLATYAYYQIKDKTKEEFVSIFKRDTFNTIVKDNRAYKYYKEKGCKTYERYKDQCDIDDISSRYVLSERNWNGLIDYIQENDEEEKLPF